MAVRFYGKDSSLVVLPSGSDVCPVAKPDADGFMLIECDDQTFSIFSQDFNDRAVLVVEHQSAASTD